MAQENEIKEKAKELFVDENQIINQIDSIIELAKGKIQIYEKTGEPFLPDQKEYSNKERIFLIILGFFISHESGVIDSPSVEINTIGRILGGIPNTTLSAPLKNLVDNRIVLRVNQAYQLNKHNYLKIIQFLEGLKKDGRK